MRIDSATAALALGVNADTVRRYGRLGVLTPYGPRNRREYDIEQVRALARALSGTHNSV